MPSPEIRKFDGLHLQANSFNVPDGAMEIAENVMIQSDNVITKTKGYFEWWRPGGGDTLANVRAIYTYQGTVIGAFDNGLGFWVNSFPFGGTFDSRGVLTTNTGATCAFDNQAFFAEANSNLYVTGLDGIYRLEAFDSPVRKAGVPQALNMTYTSRYEVAGTTPGILPSNSQTGYRTVFGRRDLNGNLLLSSPSDVITIGVPANETGLAYTIASNVVTVTVPNGTTSGKTGQTITISSATNTALNGSHTITSTPTSTTFTFAAVQPDGSGTLTVGYMVSPTVSAQIPTEINDLTEEWFVQFYRTLPSIDVTVSPTPAFYLVNEQPITATDLLQRYVTWTDTVDQALFGPELYTNENSREGELQTNTRPPKAKVLGEYKGYNLYSNVVTVQRLFLDMKAVSAAEFEPIHFRQGLVTESYVQTNPLYNPAADITPRTVSATGVGVIVINYGSHSFPVGSIVFVTDNNGTIPIARYSLIAVGSTTMTISAPGASATTVTVRVVRSTDMFSNTAFLYNGSIALPNDATPGQIAEFTARNLVDAINLNSQFMYANYTSGFDQFPGKITIVSKTIGEPIFVASVTDYFIQDAPSSFGVGIPLYSENDILPNALFFSKVGEPEAVPPLNYRLVGNASSAILATYKLRDCVIIVKEDGVFKLSGDTAGDFTITPIDTTVRFPGNAFRIAGFINNTVIGFCNQGVVQITETSLQVSSRRIDDVIQPLIGRDLQTTFLGGNEPDRLFYVNTKGINEGDPDVCYVFNILNDTWTTTTSVFLHLSHGPDDANFGILFDAEAGSFVIHRQRKTQTLVDYTGKYVVGSLEVDPDKLSGFFIVTGGNPVSPAPGDAILYNNVFSRIISSTAGGGGFALTFSGPTNIPVGPNAQVVLYKAYRSSVRLAPFHAGQVGLSKHFSEFQITLRQPAISDLRLTFGGEYLGSSELTNWSVLNLSSVGSMGWGYSPWGFFPWGLAQGIKLSSGTQSSSIIRTYVPRFAARNIFIQPDFTHTVAGQPMLIQSMTFTCRGYGQRTSK